MYCSAHAPLTPVPPDDRPLKLCWSCVLEGAAPLPSPLTVESNDDEKEEAGVRGVADVRSLIAAAAAEDEDDRCVHRAVVAFGIFFHNHLDEYFSLTIPI